MNLPPLREVITRHGLFASKALGQNFLFDEQLLDRIAAIPGKLEGKANGKLAQFQLSTVRNLLDRQMKQAYPEWGDFLKGHRAMMKEADQVQIGAGLLASGRAVPDAVNDPVLTPAAFVRAAFDIDMGVDEATATAIVAGLTAILVYLVPNKPKKDDSDPDYGGAS